MSYSVFDDNSTLYDVTLNKFTRPSEPTANTRLQKAVLRLVVLDATLNGTLPAPSRQAVISKGGSVSRPGYSYVNEAYLRDYDALQEQYQTALNGIVAKHKGGSE